MEKNPDPGSGINIPDNISESLETVLGQKILTFFLRIRDPNLFDPGSGMEKFGSAALTPIIKFGQFYCSKYRMPVGCSAREVKPNKHIQQSRVG
jgi:hypothetical protein